MHEGARARARPHLGLPEESAEVGHFRREGRDLRAREVM